MTQQVTEKAIPWSANFIVLAITESVKSQGRISLKRSLLGLNLDLKIGDGRGHSVEVVHGVGSE